MKGIGLFGAQRVGKTTLAQHYAELHGIRYLRVSAADVLARHGATARDYYPLQRRLSLQRAVLDDFSEKWQGACEQDLPFITDRTPLDLYAYMMADISRDCPSRLAPAITHYFDDCVQAFYSYFNCAILVQPGVPLVEDPKSAPASVPFMRHFNTLALGIAGTVPRVFVLDEDVLNLDERASFVHRVALSV